MDMKYPFLLVAAILWFSLGAYGQRQSALSAQEESISAQIGQLRKLPDEVWTPAVGKLARQIQQLPPGAGKEILIGNLGNLVTEGDAGRDTLQVVASTMAQVLRDSPNSPVYSTLAELVRYEHLEVSLDNPKYRAALAELEQEDLRRQNPEFTLRDLKGVEWTFKSLRGKVVLVNFWATWCPPCRKEMPDMEALYQRFGPHGLVILAISDETAEKVEPFIAAQKYNYSILLDPGRKVHQLFSVSGIPKSFLYDRNGKLVTQAIDRRTGQQFLAMLKQAGLE
jgi:peroxiredoxin